MSQTMDLGTLVAAIQVKDQDFERVLNKAAQLTRTTERQMTQALSDIKLDADISGFEKSMKDAPKTAQQSSRQIASALSDIKLDADISGFEKSMKDAPKTAQQSSRQIASALSDVDQALKDQTKAVENNVKAWATNRLDPERISELKRLNVATDDYISAISGVPAAQSRVKASLEGNADALRQMDTDTRKVAESQREFDRTMSQIAGTLDKQSGAVTENTRVWAANKIGTEQLRTLENLGISTQHYVDAAVGVPGALQRMQTALDGNSDALHRLDTITGQVSQAQRDFELRQRAIGDSAVAASADVNRAANLIDRAGDASGRATPLVGGLGNAFDRARTAMVALFAADQFIDFIRESVGAASDFEQSVGAVGAVFGDMSDQIEEFGRTTATQIGVAKGEYQEMASIFGAQLKNMGVSANELVPTTNKLITLGSDLAAQFGGTTSEAVAALGSLLRGERDPIERYGVGLKQADINARLAADGMDGLSGAAEKQANLQATLGLLFDQTASAQGAFSRETDTLATKQQIANAKFEEAKATIGEKLLPLWTTFTDMLTNDGVPALEAVGAVFSDILEFLAPVVGFFADLPGPIQAAAIALAAVVLLNGPLVKTGATLAAIATGSGAAAVGMSRFAFSMKAALATLGGPIGLAIIGITTALSFMGGESDDTTVSVEGLAAAVDDATGKFRSNAQEIAVNEVVSSGLAQQYAKMGGNVDDLVIALLGNEEAQARVNAKAAEFEKYARTNSDIDLYNAFTGAYSQGLDTIADSQDKGAIKAKLNAEASAQLAKVQGEGAVAADDAKASWDDMTESQKLAKDQTKFFTEALKDAVEAAQLLADNTGAAQMMSAFKTEADKATRAGDLFKIQLDLIDGRSRSMDDATADQQKTLAALTSAWDEGTRAATENSEAGNLNTQALRDWNVQALTATSDGQALYGELGNMADQHIATAAAAYSDAVAHGDVAGAADKARYAASLGRQQFVDLATQYLDGNVPAAEALADKLGIVDGTHIDDKFFETVNDDADAQAKLKAAQDAVILDKKFQIFADAATAQTEADTLNRTLKEIDGKTVEWFAVGNVVVQRAGTADAQNAADRTPVITPGGGVARRDGGWIGLAGGGTPASGWVRGPGGPTDDLVVAEGPGGAQVRLSPTEFVTRGAIAQRTGPFLEALNAGDPLAMSLAGVIKRADGGSIGAGPDGAAPAAAAFGASLQGSVTAPDVEVLRASWDAIAGIVEAAWTGRILPVLDALTMRNIATGEEFRALADDQVAPSWLTISDAILNAQQGVIQPTYDLLNLQTQGVGTWQQWLRDVVTETWQTSQDATAASFAAVSTGVYMPLSEWLSRLGVEQQGLASTTDQAWSQIGARIQGTYEGQIVPSWTGVQGFANETGSFFAGVAAGMTEASDTTIANLGEINKALDDFFAMVDGKTAAAPAATATASVTPTMQAFATGGIVAGADLGRDSQVIAVRGGEPVMIPEFGRAVGGEPGVRALNAAAKAGTLGDLMPGFAGGGIVGEKIRPGVASSVTSAAQAAMSAGIEEVVRAFAPVLQGFSGPVPEGARGAFLQAVASKMGTEYVWGAAGPNVFDCSGLISWALEQAGVGKGRLTAEGFNSGFPHVAEAKPGDMVTFDTGRLPGLAGHIGAVLDPAAGTMMHTDGAGPARISDYRNRGGLLGFVDVIGGTYSTAPQNKAGDPPAEGFVADMLSRLKSGGVTAGAVSAPVDGAPQGWGSARGQNTNSRDQWNTQPTQANVGYVPQGDPVGRWAPWVGYGLQLSGNDSNENRAAGLLQIRTESSGIPWAMNRSDSNFQKGYGSKGLRQIIGPTFDSHAVPGYDTNIVDPASNLLATDAYGISNYGSITNAFRGVAYDKGGPMPPGIGMFGNFTNQTEEVLTGNERDAWVQQVRQGQHGVKVEIVLRGGDVLAREMASISHVIVDGELAETARILETAKGQA